MKIKYFIFIFLLLTLVFAQNGQDPGKGDDNKGNDPADGNGKSEKPDSKPGDNSNDPSNDNTKGGKGGKGNDGNDNNPDNGKTNGGNPDGDNPNGGNPNDNTNGGNAKNIPAQTTKQPDPAVKTIITTTVAPAPKTVQPAPTKSALPTSQPPSNLDNGTPVPRIELKGDTETHNSKNDTNWTQYLLIGGGVIGGLFVVGIIFNFINKKKESNKDINDINFVVDNPAPEPEMSTSMFTPQNNMYGGQPEQQYNDYDMQYGQYGANNTQYNPPADQYGQGYGAQDVNFAQRTLSLNRNPSANSQNYQVDQNAREVIYNHRPEAGDEIELRRGDQATIYEKYEDGWAWGYNITTGKTGMFPQQCLA